MADITMNEGFDFEVNQVEETGADVVEANEVLDAIPTTVPQQNDTCGEVSLGGLIGGGLLVALAGAGLGWLAHKASESEWVQDQKTKHNEKKAQRKAEKEAKKAAKKQAVTAQQIEAPKATEAAPVEPEATEEPKEEPAVQEETTEKKSGKKNK